MRNSTVQDVECGCYFDIKPVAKNRPNIPIAIVMMINFLLFNIAKNRGINRTRHESVTMLQRYLNIFLLRVKIWSVYIETSITLSSGLKYMKRSMDSHKWAFQIKNIVQSRCAVLSFSDTGVDDLLTLDCFYCAVLTWLLQCKLLLLAFEVLLGFSHGKTGFCVFF